jgi:enoyl-CoA hydratase/carnithine racemase
MITVTTNGGIATLLMSRPPVNAIDHAFIDALNGALAGIEKSKPTAVVLRSDQKCFSAGADLAMIQGYFAKATGTAEMVDYVKALHSVYNRLEKLEAVTIAAIAGAALGGGLELALSCDMRIATATAKIGLPEARIGMIPGAGGTQRLPRLVGPGIAARMILGGEVIDGHEAARLGVVQWVVAPDAIDAKVAEVSERVAGLARPALASCKACMAAFFDPAKDGFALEIDQPLTLMETREARERIAAFFATRK